MSLDPTWGQVQGHPAALVLVQGPRGPALWIDTRGRSMVLRDGYEEGPRALPPVPPLGPCRSVAEPTLAAKARAWLRLVNGPMDPFGAEDVHPGIRDLVLPARHPPRRPASP